MSVFHFKQFSIVQGNSAMKVSTDACLFGAVVATLPCAKIAKRILDIGTGTGLLSLMMAQANETATINALEIDAGALENARHNFQSSPWRKNLTLVPTDANDFSDNIKYDLVISNPPFYEQQLTGPDISKNLAHHEAGLTLAALLEIGLCSLSANGCLAILLPYYRKNECIDLARQKGLFPATIFEVKHSIYHKAKRVILVFTINQTNIEPQAKEIIIYEKEGEYTPAFLDYLKPYYLYL